MNTTPSKHSETKFIPQFKVFTSNESVEMVSKVLQSGYIGQGPKVDEFESKLQDILDFDSAITVNSCTSALWLALHLADVGEGDYVISTPMTCSATNEVITLRGAKIIWADIDQYGNIDPASVHTLVGLHETKLMRNRLKAVMAVDWGGLPANYDSLRAALKPFDIPIIQDAAHSFMATYLGEPISRSGGDYVCFSFQAIKHLTTGDGGLLVTPSSQYERAKLLRWYGLDRTSADAMRCRQDIKEAGYKFHMNDISAAIGLGNLPYMYEVVSAHRENANYYDEQFAGLNLAPKAPSPDYAVSSQWIYTIHVPKPLKFEEYMKRKGIGVSQVHNRNDYYSCFGDATRQKLDNLDEWYTTMSAIPVGWWLSEEDKETIVYYVKKWIELAS